MSISDTKCVGCNTLACQTFNVVAMHLLQLDIGCFHCFKDQVIIRVSFELTAWLIVALVVDVARLTKVLLGFAG